MKAWLVVLERRGVFRDVLVVILAGLCAAPVTMWIAADPKGPHEWWKLSWAFAVLQVMGAMIYRGLRFLVAQAHEEWWQPLAADMRREVRELEAAQASDKRGALTMEGEP